MKASQNQEVAFPLSYRTPRKEIFSCVKFSKFLSFKGFVLYSSTLAFFIPFVILGILQFVIFLKKNQFQTKRVKE